MRPRYEQKPGNYQQAGFSLIETVIALAAMMGLILAIVSLQSTIGQNLGNLSQTMAEFDLEQSIIRTLSQQGACDAIFQSANNFVNPTDLIFDASNVSAAKPHSISLNKIPSSTPNVTLATAGSVVSPFASSLALNPTNANNPGIQLNVTGLNPPTAILILNFDQSKLMQALKPLQFRLRLKTTIQPPSTKTKIMGCSLYS